jgi:thiol:disulfide interchange protein/DsbC/DsbD-like thiol-disulfide interchange protein
MTSELLMRLFRYGMKYLYVSLGALALFFCFSSVAFSLESSAVTSPRAHVTVVSSVDIIPAGKSFYIGLRFQLTKGWHIYWSNPGDAGQPPTFHLQLDPGVTNSGIEWPTPIRLREGPAMVFAYTGDITLPVKVTVPASFTHNKLKLVINADWLVCADHCVPEKGHFEIAIPVGTEKASAQSALIEASLTRKPIPSPFDIHVTDQDVMMINDAGLSAQTVQDAWFFPNEWGVIENAAQQKLIFGKKGIMLELQHGSLFKAGAPLAGILVLRDAGGKESYYSVKAAPEIMNAHWSDWARTLVFALLGGLILNLMPCVFPVLAIKALSIAKLSNKERLHIREQAFFYTLGVLVAFLAIALILLVVRAAGESVGWGFQFQSPIFVTCMSWLMLAIGLNLSGVYLFGARMMGVGESYARKTGNVGGFFTGLLAVVVATPCVAPFMGAAIATALMASPVGMLMIFLAMGFGLALPYTMLALCPGIARIFPRPGVWMETLKQGLAFPMYAACAWLLWVLSQQDGPEGLAYALGGVILIALIAWLIGQVSFTHQLGRFIKNGFVIVSVILVCVLLFEIGKLPMAAVAATHAGPNEEAYTEERLQQLQASGQPVFVDMTAAWCITCLVNERVAIASESVQAAFAQKHIVYLKGDWTQQDPSISRFLQQHGSDGVPLYVFYPGKHGTPVVLPQILTPSIVLNVLDQPQT